MSILLETNPTTIFDVLRRFGNGFNMRGITRNLPNSPSFSPAMNKTFRR